MALFNVDEMEEELRSIRAKTSEGAHASRTA